MPHEGLPTTAHTIGRTGHVHWTGFVLAWTLFVLAGVGPILGQDKNADSKELEPASRLVPLPSPLNDESLGQVRRTLLELQDVANREGREAYLILELTPGVSEFHHCYAIADLLTSEPLERVTTIAWVPETVTGNNVLVALACQEIVMHPDAQMGDMGRGDALPNDQQTIVKGIVAKRRNQKVSEALALAFMNPRESLVQLTIEADAGMKETRLASSAEARKLREDGTVILETKTVSEAGTPALIDGRKARSFDILTMRTAQSRRELVAAYGLSLDNLKELAPAEELGKVAYIELHDMIDDVFAAFAERQIDRAILSGAKMIVFEIDSPGGILPVCMDLSMKMARLSEREIKTVAYIPSQAYSGGAILAVACDEIYMHPDATIGDAIPINMMGNVILHAEAKILSVETEHLRKLAEMKDRPAAILEAFADKDLEVFEVTHKTTGRKWFMSGDEAHKAAEEWELGPRVAESRPGVAITIHGRRANDLMIAKPPIKDVSELKEQLGIPLDHEFRPVGRTWVDSLVFNLNRPGFTGFLLFIAIVCIYLEVATMTGIFGIISALSFGIFFWSRMLGGTATGLEVALFVIGLGCLAMEFFVIPGFGVFGVTGILLVLASLVMAGQTFTGLNMEYDILRAGQTFATLALAILAVIVTSVFLSHHMHRIPIVRSLVLAPPGNSLSEDAPRLRPESTGPESDLLGEQGTAVTILRPAGKARINGQMRDVVSDGPFIAAGANVEVVQVQRNRIVVREA
ncbi:MAG: hypothetical protein KDA80_23625 [Planctomycetaceae bacterium]|nr:hypothetical protein [Planctomycetaceae bacterium]